MSKATFGNDGGAGLCVLAGKGAEPINQISRLGGLGENRTNERTEVLRGDSPHPSTILSVGKKAGILALFMRSLEQREVPELGEDAPQFGLKDDEHGDGKECGESAKQGAKDLQVEKAAHNRKAEEHHQKANQDGKTARASNEGKSII